MRTFFFLIPLLFFCVAVQAQETMAKEISNEFLEKLITTAKTNYPKMKSLEARVDVSRYGYKKAKLSYFELLSMSYIYTPRNTATAINPNFLNGYQFGVFFNVGSLIQKPSVIKQAKSELEVIEAEKETFELSLVAEIQQRYYVYVQRTVFLRLASQALLDVESMMKEIRYKFEKGEETLDNYNKILLMYNNQTQNRVSAETELLVAKSSLEEMVGQKLETIK
jgi:outer membrane protein TolC